MGTQIASENIAEELIYCFKTTYRSTVQFPLGSAKRFGEFQILGVEKEKKKDKKGGGCTSELFMSRWIDDLLGPWS